MTTVYGLAGRCLRPRSGRLKVAQHFSAGKWRENDFKPALAGDRRWGASPTVMEGSGTEPLAVASGIKIQLTTLPVSISRSIFLSVCLCGILGFAACTSSVPSEADAREYFENEGKEKCGGLYEVKSFRKTDGAQPGENQYVLEFEADVQCLTVEQANQFSGLVGCWHPVGAFHCDSLGSKHVKGHIRFFKSEKGWNPSKV